MTIAIVLNGTQLVQPMCHTDPTTKCFRRIGYALVRQINVTPTCVIDFIGMGRNGRPSLRHTPCCTNQDSFVATNYTAHIGYCRMRLTRRYFDRTSRMSEAWISRVTVGFGDYYTIYDGNSEILTFSKNRPMLTKSDFDFLKLLRLHNFLTLSSNADCSIHD